jgi:hypothetical protein
MYSRVQIARKRTTKTSSIFLEVIQQACPLLTLKLICCFVPIPVLATKPSVLALVLESLSAKLVPIFHLGNRRARRSTTGALFQGLRPYSLQRTRESESLSAFTLKADTFLKTQRLLSLI